MGAEFSQQNSAGLSAHRVIFTHTFLSLESTAFDLKKDSHMQFRYDSDYKLRQNSDPSFGPYNFRTYGYLEFCHILHLVTV